jgi:hypothetical protein
MIPAPAAAVRNSRTATDGDCAKSFSRQEYPIIKTNGPTRFPLPGRLSFYEVPDMKYNQAGRTRNRAH